MNKVIEIHADFTVVMRYATGDFPLQLILELGWDEMYPLTLHKALCNVGKNRVWLWEVKFDSSDLVFVEKLIYSKDKKDDKELERDAIADTRKAIHRLDFLPYDLEDLEVEHNLTGLSFEVTEIKYVKTEAEL